MENSEEIYEYPLGTTLKFVVNLTAEGFSQATDEYEIVIVCNNKRITIPKANVIEGLDNNYYITVDTSQFQSGLVKAIAYAMIPDADLSRVVDGQYVPGYRREVGSIDLCYLVKP